MYVCTFKAQSLFVTDTSLSTLLKPNHHAHTSTITPTHTQIHTLTITPTHTQIRSFFQPPMEGVILQTYGAGNIPDTSTHSDIFHELKSACERGVVIVNCTQCSQGTVSENYAGGIVSTKCSIFVEKAWA